MPLIAREDELAELVGRVRNNRLVTLVGPGGIGKTALARAASEIVGPEFAYGSRLVDLTRVDDPDGVREAIAGQLGFADFRSLIESPGDQPALLVVDNCEHVLDAAAAAIDGILAGCRMPSVLATSRSPLDVVDEVIMPVAPLQIPTSEVDADGVGSVEMFVERVTAFGGTVGPDDVATVAEICRRLDGVPLALEIAAARSRVNTLAEILDEIGQRPAALARPRFRGHSAHRSVTDMVEWSLQLLSDDARCVFESLGVVAGPFTAAMADAVVDECATPIGDVLDELVGASLVVADTSGATTWYRLLHPVRAVASDRLRRAGGVEATVDRAVDYVVALAIEVVVGSSDGWDDQLTTLLGMYDNMIASLRWANEHDERPDRALTLLAVLWGVVHQAHTSEVAAVGEAVLSDRPDPSAPFWSDAAATVATCRNLLGRHDEAIELATAALEHVGASPFAPASLRRVIAQASRARGESEQSRDWFAAGADAAEEQGVHGIAMELRVDQALLIAELGDPGGALQLIDEVLAEARRRSAPVNIGWAMGGRGAVLRTAGDRRAREELEAAVAYSRSISYPAGVSFSLRMLAAEHLDRGDRVAAAATLLELLYALLERGGLNDLRMVLDHTALLLEEEGDDRWVDVAATAQSLPVTTVGVAVRADVFERAADRGTVLATRTVYTLCRERLTAIAAGSTVAGAAAGLGDGVGHGDDDDDTPGGTADGAGTGSAEDTLVREGDAWRWTFAGESIVVKASKGMTDLHRLLAEPGREISALDLMGSRKAADAPVDTLDARARHEIEARIRELQGDLEEADAHHDIARSERAAAELDRLVDELSSAIGLGGRARSTGSDPERARSAVTQRIRSTIARIDRLHPKLGGHLSTSVETGTFCVYRADPPRRWHTS